VKAKAADQEMMIRMVNTPYKYALLHALKKRQKQAALAAAQGQGQEPEKGGKKGKSGE
jgi:hypothetical protein